jgi:hypothetical protein
LSVATLPDLSSRSVLATRSGIWVIARLVGAQSDPFATPSSSASGSCQSTCPSPS